MVCKTEEIITLLLEDTDDERVIDILYKVLDARCIAADMEMKIGDELK